MGKRSLLLVAVLLGGAGCGSPSDETNPDKDKAALERFENASDSTVDMGGANATPNAAGK